MGTQPLSPKGGRARSPIFGPFLLWPNGWMHEDATWYGGRPQPRGLCVRWGPSHTPPPPAPQFSAHVYCGQTTGWIKMALDMEAGLGRGHLVLDEDPAPLPQKRGLEPPIFGPFLQRAQCSHYKRCISYSISVHPSVCLSVRPSVCLSHAGIVSKRRHIARSSLHRWITKCV